MDPYVSENEQLEAIKNWWKANGGAIVTGIAIGLVVVLGWQYWNSHQVSQAEQASLRYDRLSQALERADNDQARRQAQALLEEYPSSIYAVLAALQLAGQAAQQGATADARARLEWVIDHTDQAELKTIARLRLARVLLAEGRYDDAEAQLKGIDDPSFIAEVEELKGDLYLARNEPDKARTAYQTALTTGRGGALVQLKLDNLPPAKPKE